MFLNSLKGLFLGRDDVLDMNPAKPKFSRSLALKFAFRNRGSVRLSHGLFYTEEEWKKRRKTLQERPLP
jgi:hypothetical protein